MILYKDNNTDNVLYIFTMSVILYYIAYYNIVILYKIDINLPKTNYNQK